ncbi:MAG TPA: bifunctional folylpolyglutamate synthase/dihydrofolate synthase [Gammaproteobacteria bacterium]|nr:bifunctional folylpolyglutamate synthase/dihydrofolate synthase [Gammaproteobacteria bacterium]
MRDLPAWLDYISRQHTQTIDLGLERFQAMLTQLDLNHPAPKIITVAGTNGKGTTTLALEHLLQASGLSVGATLSPHISRFNERIRLFGREADDQTICGAFQAIEDQRQLPLTYFEFAALAALWCMREAKVDVALLEIGLGGRLDAFNAVDAHVAVITSIGLDHQAFLGETREAIGAEKAGILRRQQDVVLGADMPASVLDRAQALGLSPRRYGRQFRALTDESGSWRLMDEAGEGEPTSLGSIPPHNLALAVQAALFLTPQAREHVASAAGVRVPGRLQEIEYRDRRIILDVAHNPDSVAFLFEQLTLRGLRPDVLICSMLAEKDHAGVYRAVRLASGAPLLLVDSQGPRACTGQQQLALISEQGLPIPEPSLFVQMPEAVAAAVGRTDPGSTILIFGSFSAVEQSAWLAS